MIRRSWLDSFLERFQHRWETNPQYRATMSGVLGIVFLVFMCACVGLVSVSTQSALAAMGFGGSNNNNAADQSSAYTGSKAAHGVATIPIATVNLGTPATIPDATLPPSGTPLPTPTLAPTPTDTPTPPPCTSNCGGGGGGGGSISVRASPNKWSANMSVTLYVHSSSPNIQFGFIVAFSSGAPDTSHQQPVGTTDGSGNGTTGYTVPSGVPPGPAQITIYGSDGSIGGTSVQVQ